MDLKYRRIMLKISGEALSGEKGFGIDQTILNNISSKIKEAHDMGVDIGIVVGGGNFWRGISSTGMDRTTAEPHGNAGSRYHALALRMPWREGVPTRVQTALEMQGGKPISEEEPSVIEKSGYIAFACGTKIIFLNDTAAVLRAAEIEAEVILLAKNVDAVYDSDPKLNPNALKYDRISFMDVLSKQLGVMDSTATSLCMDNNIPLVVFSIREPENIIKVLNGVNVGTFVAREV